MFVPLHNLSLHITMVNLTTLLIFNSDTRNADKSVKLMQIDLTLL